MFYRYHRPKSVIASALVVFMMLSWLSPFGREVFHVETAEAVGVYTERQSVVGSEVSTGEAFGDNLDMTPDGTRMIVGSPYDTVGGVQYHGSAYVFARTGDTWTEEAQLLGDDTDFGDFFGYSVAISGDGSRAVVTATGAGSGVGAAYVFSRTGSVWTQEWRLAASDGASGSQFGGSVDMDASSRIIVGAHQASVTGKAYVFSRIDTTWSEEQIIAPSDGTAGDSFGLSVTMSSDGSNIAIGTLYGSNYSTWGSVYVYTRSGSVWAQQQKVTATDGLFGGDFGRKLSMCSDGSRFIVSRAEENDYQGSAYVFFRTAGVWSEEQKLTVSPDQSYINFGNSVAMSDDCSVVSVGVPWISDEQGAIYTFVRTGSVWAEDQILTSSDGVDAPGFGQATDISSDGSYLVGSSTDANSEVGAVYYFSASVPTPPAPPLGSAYAYSMSMSSSAPGQGNNLTLSFTTSNPVPAGLGKILIDFPAGFDLNGIDSGDIDLLIGGSDIALAPASSGAVWGANVSGQRISLSSDTGTIGANAAVVIKIGTHASYGTTGDTQIINPSSAGSYQIHFETFDDTIDTGDVWVAIVDPVWLTADVNSYFDFVVSGVSTGTYEGITTDVTSTDTAADFGTLTPNTPKVSASKLSAKTNAGSGFVVTVEQNHNLLASSGADIDSFKDGAASANTAWASPAATNGNADTYGHLGFNTTDNAVAGLTASANYFGLSGTTQQPVFSHPNPVSGGAYWSGTDIDGANSAYLFYKLEVSALQEPGHYQSRLMYIGTATF